MLGITIRLGAAHDSVTTNDGTVIDRSRLTGPQRRKLSRMVRDIYDRHQQQQRKNDREA